MSSDTCKRMMSDGDARVSTAIDTDVAGVNGLLASIAELNKQISRLEGELATRLLVRHATGVLPTDAGLAFLRHGLTDLRDAVVAVAPARRAMASVQEPRVPRAFGIRPMRLRPVVLPSQYRG